MLRTKFLRIDQQQMAAKLNLPQATFSHYERGRRRPSLAFLRRLQEEFQVDLNWVLGGSGHWRLSPGKSPRQATRVPRPALHPDDEELLDMVRRRLEARDDPHGFSRPVAVFVEGNLSASRTFPAGEQYRAFPYTLNVDVIGKPPLPQDEVNGFFVLGTDMGPPPEHVRCVRTTRDTVLAGFPPGSVIAVDIRAQAGDPERLEGQILMLAWQEPGGQERRILARLRQFLPRTVFEPLERDQRVPGDRDMEDRRVRIIGQVAWAWHPVE